MEAIALKFCSDFQLAPALEPYTKVQRPFPPFYYAFKVDEDRTLAPFRDGTTMATLAAAGKKWGHEVQLPAGAYTRPLLSST
jgi:hypothetical protein